MSLIFTYDVNHNRPGDHGGGKGGAGKKPARKKVKSRRLSPGEKKKRPSGPSDYKIKRRAALKKVKPPANRKEAKLLVRQGLKDGSLGHKDRQRANVAFGIMGKAGDRALIKLGHKVKALQYMNNN